MLSCVDAWSYRGVCDCVAVCCSEYIAVCCSVFRCVVAVGHRAALQKHADICCNVHMLFEDATTMRQTPHTTLYCTAYRLHGDMCGITHPCTFHHYLLSQEPCALQALQTGSSASSILPAGTSTFSCVPCLSTEKQNQGREEKEETKTKTRQVCRHLRLVPQGKRQRLRRY